MLRLIALFVLLLLAGLALWKLARWMRTREWDWSGIAFAIAFVVMAFWLRDVTGMGD